MTLHQCWTAAQLELFRNYMASCGVLVFLFKHRAGEPRCVMPLEVAEPWLRQVLQS